MITFVRGLLAAALTALPLLTATPTHAAEVTLRDAIDALPVADESRTGYERSAFRHWVDADGDGCTTRSEVLLAESVGPLTTTGRCKITGGRWVSYYDRVEVTDPRKLDIDHLVPLAEAWDSGASRWSAARRQAYANDLTADRSLVAVTARTNRSKADQDPTTWMPPAAQARCTYIEDWTATKTRWDLKVDADEKNKLVKEAATCPDSPLDIPRA
ncbi:HNH endonuclease family protein [Streptomyces sp. NPDC057702]|uniref:HNH endonuclease family protein n=1 Tax=Streptomyces sp. NPDC057702 TaxID=3346221 RepID=UPI0036CA3CFF